MRSFAHPPRRRWQGGAPGPTRSQECVGEGSGDGWKKRFTLMLAFVVSSYVVMRVVCCHPCALVFVFFLLFSVSSCSVLFSCFAATVIDSSRLLEQGTGRRRSNREGERERERGERDRRREFLFFARQVFVDLWRAAGSLLERQGVTT